MAAAAGNAAAVPDKMQFRGGVGGEAQHHYGQSNQRQQWLPDERDGFILWLKGEFAAANAIIDSLCHHLRDVGDGAEYDAVIGCIQQRRCNWAPVLHMQQYFPVGEVAYALQQATWRRQQRCLDHVKGGGEKEFKKHGPGSRPRDRPGFLRNPVMSPTAVNGYGEKAAEKLERVSPHLKGEEVNVVGEKGSVDVEGKEGFTASRGNSSSKDGDNALMIGTNRTGYFGNNGSTSHAKGFGNDTLPKNTDVIPGNDEKWKTHKNFVGDELYEGKMENFVEGLKLYEDLFEISEIINLVSMANNLRNVGQRGTPKGKQIYTAAKRPMRGHGREIIQLGVPVLDRYTEESTYSKVDAIPKILQDIFERLVRLQIAAVRPDYCIIDFFNEGDHSQPHSWPSCYGRPVFNLLLTECDFIFGKTISTNHRGDYQGSIRLPLMAGSLLVMEGKSSDVAKHAISTMRKQRIILRFGKSQPRMPTVSDVPNLSSMTPTSPWGRHPSRLTNNGRQPPLPKQYGVVSAAGVLQPPPGHPQNMSPPIYVSQAPLPPNVVSYPVAQAPVPLLPASSGWNGSVPPRQTAPRILAPGTGVFLPHGTGQVLVPQQPIQACEADAVPKVTPAEILSECEIGIGKFKCESETSSNDIPDGVPCKHECNGSINNDVVAVQMTFKEEKMPINSKKQLISKPANTDVAA